MMDEYFAVPISPSNKRAMAQMDALLAREGIERAEAIAAGIMENRRHERVNQILEEEIERLQSSTAKRTGRAYLSVIEGGTASFAPLRAEA